ncbi:MAG: hypothetical protein ABJB01_01720 [Rudaea sp.]
MDEASKRAAGPLIRSVALLQIKLFLGAARDLALSPLTLAAALMDIMRLKSHEPTYLKRVLKAGERSEEWIDLWSGARDDADSAPRANVDALLLRVEEVVRDPQSGARRARVLKRWAERKLSKKRNP